MKIQPKPQDLSTAVKNNDIDKVKLLVENGANVNEKDKSGSTPLHHAAWMNAIDIMEYLLENKADPNVYIIFIIYLLFVLFYRHKI